MTKEVRDAVVSLRISAEEQAQLRELAEARGSSVSDLIRTVVMREVAPRTAATPSSPTTTSSGTRPEEGFFWQVSEAEATSDGAGNLTLRA